MVGKISRLSTIPDLGYSIYLFVYLFSLPRQGAQCVALAGLEPSI